LSRTRQRSGSPNNPGFTLRFHRSCIHQPGNQWRLDRAMAGLLKRLLPKKFRKEGVVIPVVRLHGAIAAGGSQFRPALNLAGVAQSLEKAFAVKGAPAVALSVNSPGGSPVQSRLIF